jgi:hypothetical protein
MRRKKARERGSDMEKIKWVDWSPKAFERARAEDKLVLLDIGAVWCHWCHVMDEEAYSDPVIIEAVNENFVAIRVDNDERPDVNERYNQGGWPTTVVMTPDGLIVHGATYLPAASVKDLLEKCRLWFDNNRHKVTQAAAGIETGTETRTETGAGTAGTSKAPSETRRPAKDFSDAIIADMMKAGDPEFGGLGMSQKFPHPAAIELALAEYFRKGDPALLVFVEKALLNMAEGLIDREEGGLFRYSVSRDWKTPHYEKNLDVNATSLRTYLDAYRVTGNEKFADAAGKIIDCFMGPLADRENGGFYGSRDADIFDEEHQKILMDGEEFYKLSLDERARHGNPYIDETIYTNWNALMVSSFLGAYHALGREDCRDFALKTLDLLMTRCVSEEGGTYHFLKNGLPQGPSLLTDGVALARACLDAYEATAEKKHFDAAVRLMDVIENTLGAGSRGGAGGGYYDSVPDESMPPATRIANVRLPDNALAVETLARLAALTGDDSYMNRARAALTTFEQDVEAMLKRGIGYFGSEYALASQYLDGAAAHVCIVGRERARETMEFLRAANRAYNPAKIIQLLDADQDITIIKERGFDASASQPIAYLCKNMACEAPISDALELHEALSKP